MAISAALVKELRERTGAGMMECKKALVETDGDIDTAIEHMRKSGMAKADKKAGRVAAEGKIAIAVSADQKKAAMLEVNCETDFVAKDSNFEQFVHTVAQRALESEAPSAEAVLELPLDKAGGPSVDEARRELIARIGENISVRRCLFLERAGDTLGVYLHQGGRIGVVVDLKGGDERLAKDIAMHVVASKPVCVSADDVPAELVEREKEIFRAQAEQSGKPADIVEKMVTGRLKKFLDEVSLLGQPFVKDLDKSMEKLLKEQGAQVLRFERLEVGEGVDKKSENFADEVMAQVRGS